MDSASPPPNGHPLSPSATTPSNSEKESKPFACVLCQQRKVKCDKKYPCAACQKARVECFFRAPVPPRRRKRQSPEHILLARLKRYEGLLREHGIPYTDSKGVDVETAESQENGDHDGADGKDQTLEGGHLILEDGNYKYLASHPWTTLYDDQDIDETLIESGDDAEGNNQPQLDHKLMDPYGGDLVVGPYPPQESLRAFHPPQAFFQALWQTYLDNVNSVIKLGHTPTLRNVAFQAYKDLDHIPKDIEAIMFGVYCMATISLNDGQCQTMFGERREVMLRKYQFALRQALLRAEFLRSYDPKVLAAFSMYLMSMRTRYDAGTLWTLTGMCLRIGQKIGLHRDGELLNLPPYEVEMRRRLWWHMVSFDTRSAELCGSDHPWLSLSWDTKLPANVNDADIFPGMLTPPIEHKEPTEMTFCIMRFHITDFLRTAHSNTSLGGSWQKLRSPKVPLAEKDKAIDALERLFEDKYLKYVDPVQPLHMLCQTMARCAICKMRLVAHHPRNYPQGEQGAMSQAEKDLLFDISVKLLSYTNLSESTPQLQRYLWHIENHIQWDSIFCTLSELRERTVGDGADRAWKQLNDFFGNFPDTINDTKKYLHLAVASLLLKAWAAREDALAAQSGMPVSVPWYISKLRSRRMSSRAASKASHTNPCSPTSMNNQPMLDFSAQQPMDFSKMAADRNLFADPQSYAHGSPAYSSSSGDDVSFSFDPFGNAMSQNDWTQFDALLADFQGGNAVDPLSGLAGPGGPIGNGVPNAPYGGWAPQQFEQFGV